MRGEEDGSRGVLTFDVFSPIVSPAILSDFGSSIVFFPWDIQYRDKKGRPTTILGQ
jgi:hypothetical protein